QSDNQHTSNNCNELSIHRSMASLFTSSENRNCRQTAVPTLDNKRLRFTSAVVDSIRFSYADRRQSWTDLVRRFPFSHCPYVLAAHIFVSNSINTLQVFNN